MIGGAAVVLHGGDTAVADVDVLIAPGDAERLAAALALPNLAGDGHPRFRSAWLMRWEAPPLPAELMADLHVHVGAGWRRVEPATREPVENGLFVPSVAELRTLLTAFGRPKDRARMALLDAVASRSEPRSHAAVDPGTGPG